METIEHVETREHFSERRGHFFYYLNWSAIIGGAIAAMGIHILVSALGVGAGLGMFSPTSADNPATTFSIGSAITWTICALIALAVGGFLAGRFSHSLHAGFVHGVLVWCLTLIITAGLVSVGAGMVMGGAIKVFTDGPRGAPAPAALAEESAKRSADQLTAFTDEAVAAPARSDSPGAAIKARREIHFAVLKLFSPANDVNSPENRAFAVAAVTDNTATTPENAEKMVNGWITSNKNLKGELEHTKAVAAEKSRQVADEFASNLSQAAIWSFFALLIGLVVSAFAGHYGAQRGLFHISKGAAL
jgi:hypothetical protein